MQEENRKEEKGIHQAIIEEIVRQTLEERTHTAGGYTPGRGLLTGRNISLDLAEMLMKQVETRAGQMGIPVVTAVSDAHGNPVAVRCMDGAYMGSYDVALNKTYTAIAFQMSTRALGELAGPGGELYGIQYTNQGRIVIFGGGVPLKVDGRIVGAFGVSGGSAGQDTSLAEYALEVFDKLIGFGGNIVDTRSSRQHE